MSKHISNSATGPVVGLIIGVLLLVLGGGALAILGIVLVVGSGLLFAVRLFGLAAGAASSKTDAQE